MEIFHKNLIVIFKVAGCPKCARQTVNRLGGMSGVSQPDTMVTLYFIELKGKENNYHCLKVGVTSQNIKLRLKRMTGFTKEILLSFELKAIDAVNLETLILNTFIDYRYYLPSKVLKR